MPQSFLVSSVDPEMAKNGNQRILERSVRSVPAGHSIDLELSGHRENQGTEERSETDGMGHRSACAHTLVESTQTAGEELAPEQIMPLVEGTHEVAYDQT